MTDSACWGPEIPSRLPAAIIRRPVPLVALGVVDSTVLGFIVDLYLRVIRAKVALVAGLWFSRLHNRESVSSMTTTTTAERSIRIFPSHTNIGPGAGYGAATDNFHNRTMARVASSRTLYGVVHVIM